MTLNIRLKQLKTRQDITSQSPDLITRGKCKFIIIHPKGNLTWSIKQMQILMTNISTAAPVTRRSSILPLWCYFERRKSRLLQFRTSCLCCEQKQTTNHQHIWENRKNKPPIDGLSLRISCVGRSVILHRPMPNSRIIRWCIKWWDL